MTHDVGHGSALFKYVPPLLVRDVNFAADHSSALVGRGDRLHLVLAGASTVLETASYRRCGDLALHRVVHRVSRAQPGNNDAANIVSHVELTSPTTFTVARGEYDADVELLVTLVEFGSRAKTD